MAFAQNLVHLMNVHGLTNYALAKKLGCHQSTVQNWIDGSIPQKRTQIAIAEKLGVTVEDLMGDKLPTPRIRKPLFMEESKEICQNLISMYGTALHPLKGFLPADVLQQIKKYEYAFTWDIAAQIAEHLNVSLDDLLGKKNDPTPVGVGPFEEYSELTEEEKAKVKEYAVLLLAARHKK